MLQLTLHFWTIVIKHWLRYYELIMAQITSICIQAVQMYNARIIIKIITWIPLFT